MAKLLGCSQGFLSKVLAGQKELNDEHRTKAATELGIELGAWTRASSGPAELDEGPSPEGDARELAPVDDRPGLALELTLVQLREVREKMGSAFDPIEWARLARIETAALRTLAELRGEIGPGREMKLRVELEDAKREMALIGATVKEALKPFPEAARAVGGALKRAFPSEAE